MAPTERLAAVFSEFDSGSKGVLARDELKCAITAVLGHRPTKYEIAHLLVTGFATFESFARFVDESKPRRRALSALAEYVDAKFGALCAYVGEGGDPDDSRPSSRREGNRDENENAFLTGPSRDVSELFGGLWAFAASVDAARERRLAFAEARSSFSFRAADVDRRAISCD